MIDHPCPHGTTQGICLPCEYGELTPTDDTQRIADLTAEVSGALEAAIVHINTADTYWRDGDPLKRTQAELADILIAYLDHARTRAIELKLLQRFEDIIA